MNKNKGTPPWGGCGFSTSVYLVIESKITFSHCNLQHFMVAIYDVLPFAARGQNAKKNFCNSATSAWGSMHSFFLSALSVGILRFEELAHSLDVLMLVCKSKLPWSHIDSKVGQRVFGSVILQSKGTLSSPPHPSTPPPSQGTKTSATKLGNVSSVASSYSRKERYHPPPPPLPVQVARRQQQSWATCLR